MKNKYIELVENIDKQEKIAELKGNLSEQLSMVIENVNTVKVIVEELVKVIADLQEITNAVTAASMSADNSVERITMAIRKSHKVIITSKLDDQTIKQLKAKYYEYSQFEAELFKKHHEAIGKMLDQNKDKYYEIINKGDGVYLGRKIFIRLFIVFNFFAGIILLEIVYVLSKLLVM